jgi:hypothetical protein
MKLPPDFRDLLEEFAREGVEAVVVGGYAFAFHAAPRATKDLDLLLGGSAENLAKASRALARYGAPAGVVHAVARLEADEVAYPGQPPLRVDLMRAIDGVPAPDALGRSVGATWDGLPVRVISLDDLIENKRAAGRMQDLADVERLELIRSR